MTDFVDLHSKLPPFLMDKIPAKGAAANQLAAANMMYLNAEDFNLFSPKNSQSGIYTAPVIKLECKEMNLPYDVKKHETFYPVKSLDQVQRNTIGSNRVQRDSVESKVQVVPVRQYNEEEIDLITIKCWIEPMSAPKRKKGAQAERPWEIDEKEFIDCLRDFACSRSDRWLFGRNQVLLLKIPTTVGRKVVTKFMKVYVQKLQREVKQKNGNVEHMPVDVGIITSYTTILAVSADSSRLVVNEYESGENRDLIDFESFNFQDVGIGGLDDQFEIIFRRAFASRTYPTEYVKKFDIRHLRGIVLHGPPGTGKTLIARKIGELLKGKDPKIVNGPEILSKFVGAAEENIRNLFVDAENEQKEKGLDSSLHIIIFDEMDAICKVRGTGGPGAGGQVHDTIVNQLLSKMEGVYALNNILVIGMTNRIDMIDPALLRPGRFELHLEIGLPDAKGRIQILEIHTRTLRENNALSNDVDFKTLAHLTKNYSGAELKGLVECAKSWAFKEIAMVEDKQKKMKLFQTVQVKQAHFIQALTEVKPSFGVDENELQRNVENFIDYGDEYSQRIKKINDYVQIFKKSSDIDVLSIVISGERGSGKTTLASKIALDAGIPFCKIISPQSFFKYVGDSTKSAHIIRVFQDAFKSDYSCVVLDNIDRLLGYLPPGNRTGVRFSNSVLQVLLTALNKRPPAGRKLLIIGTCSPTVFRDIGLDMKKVFNVVFNIGELTKKELGLLFRHMCKELKGYKSVNEESKKEETHNRDELEESVLNVLLGDNLSKAVMFCRRLNQLGSANDGYVPDKPSVLYFQ